MIQKDKYIKDTFEDPELKDCHFYQWDTVGQYSLKVIVNNSETVRLIQENTLSENPGTTYIWPEMGNSYNIKVEPGEMKTIVLRYPVDAPPYNESLATWSEPLDEGMGEGEFDDEEME